VGFAGNELVVACRIRVGRAIGSAALVADGLHARTEGFTSLAVVLGALGVLAGSPLAGLPITVAIVVVLRTAVRDVLRRLMDGVDPALTASATEVLLATPGVPDVEQVRLRWLGHRVTADAGVVVADDLDLATAHDITHGAEHRLRHAVPKLVGAVIHVSPAAD